VQVQHVESLHLRFLQQQQHGKTERALVVVEIPPAIPEEIAETHENLGQTQFAAPLEAEKGKAVLPEGLATPPQRDEFIIIQPPQTKPIALVACLHVKAPTGVLNLCWHSGSLCDNFRCPARAGGHGQTGPGWSAFPVAGSG